MKYNIIIIGFIALLLSGCFNGSSSTSYNEGYGFINVKIHPLASSANTIYIYEGGQTTQFTAELTNDMYLEARKVRIVPDNFNPMAIDFTPVLEITPLNFQGYTLETGYKDFQMIDSPIEVNTLNGRPYSTNLRFHLCAEAKTFVETQVCIRPQGQVDNRGGTCNPGAVTLSKGQGAPLAVTSIQQFDSGNSITFNINVVNRGKGLVYSIEDDSCGFVSQDSVGHVNLNYVRISDQPVRCERTIERLGYTQQYQSNAGATFTCIVKKSDIGMDSAGGNQIHVLQAEFSYNYHVELPSQNILIQNAPGYTSPSNTP